MMRRKLERDERERERELRDRERDKERQRRHGTAVVGCRRLLSSAPSRHMSSPLSPLCALTAHHLTGHLLSLRHHGTFQTSPLARCSFSNFSQLLSLRHHGTFAFLCPRHHGTFARCAITAHTSPNCCLCAISAHFASFACAIAAHFMLLLKLIPLFLRHHGTFFLRCAITAHEFDELVPELACRALTIRGVQDLGDMGYMWLDRVIWGNIGLYRSI